MLAAQIEWRSRVRTVCVVSCAVAAGGDSPAGRTLDWRVRSTRAHECRYTDRDGIANRMASAAPDGSWPFTFRSPASARRFREAAYERARVPMPPPWAPGAAGVPRVITFMTGAKGDEVVNHVRPRRVLAASASCVCCHDARRLCSCAETKHATAMPAVRTCSSGALCRLQRHRPCRICLASAHTGARV